MVSVTPIIKKSTLILLQSVPNEVDVIDISETIKSINGVNDIQHLHVWRLNQERIIASAHIKVKNVEDSFQENLQIMKTIERILHSNNIHATTIQIEDDAVSLDSCDVSTCQKNCKCCEETTKVENQISQV